MVKAPHIIVKAPHMMAITLRIMAKAPHTMAKSPHTMAKAPYKITNAPHEMKCYHLRQLWLSIVTCQKSKVTGHASHIVYKTLDSFDLDLNCLCC